MTIADILMARGKVLEVELLNEVNVGTGAYITIHCDVGKLKIFQIPPIPAQNHLAGLLTIIVTKVFDLSLSKEEVESFVKVKFGEKEFLTGIVVDCPDYPAFDCLNPVFDASFLVPITSELIEKGLPDIEFDLLNSWEKQTLLGSISIPCKSILEAPGSTLKESRPLTNSVSLLEFQVSLQSFQQVALPSSSSLSKPQSYLRPSEISQDLQSPSITLEEDIPLVPTDQDEIRKLKVTIINGQGFRIKKRTFRKDDIPDMYCNIIFGSSQTVWRTATIKDNANPEWNESRLYELNNHNQVISIDVWNSNRKSNDTFIGSIRVAVGKVLLNSGKMELELENKGLKIGAFVALACELE